MSKKPKKPKKRYISCPECKTRCGRNGYSYSYLSFRCGECEHSFQVEMTSAEKKYYHWKWETMSEESSKMHKVWHDFEKHFFKREKREWAFGDKTFKGHSYTGWKWLGFELMQKIDKYVKKHPEIEIASCDDDYHMNSYLVLIPHRFPNNCQAHKKSKKYWGTTVIFVCQGTRLPTQFFLYLEHEKSLLAGLKAVKKPA